LGEVEVSSRYLIIIAGAALGALPGLALAAPAAPAPAAPEAPKSTTRAQFLANYQAEFNAMDTNHDGVLDAAEVAAAQQKQAQELRARQQQQLTAEFDHFDTNHDGQLSKAEFLAAAPPINPPAASEVIGNYDANKDGKISLHEFEAPPLADFNKIDTNHDGVVTPAEIAAFRARQTH
jgi:Ca2+-binding EF-hand superfamily protein